MKTDVNGVSQCQKGCENYEISIPVTILRHLDGGSDRHARPYRNICGATNKQALAFLNRVRKISEYLGEKEAEKIKQLKQAMSPELTAMLSGIGRIKIG